MERSRDPIARIERALEQLGAEHEPPRGWEARVMAAVLPRPRRRWWWWLAPPVAALGVAAAIAVAVMPRRGAEPGPLTIAVERIASPQKVRGDYQVGDRIRARVDGGADHRAIWVYRGEAELVAACPGGSGCGHAGGALTVEVALERVGSYRVIALSSPAVLPVPRGAYDADLAAAMAADATMQQQRIEVD